MTTKWVLTINVSDGTTIHAESPRQPDLEAVRKALQSKGQDVAEPTEMPMTWECDGRDGCTVPA